MPHKYGGAEASLATRVAVLEALAAADGSAGWCTMIGASPGLMAGFLSDEALQAIAHR